MEQSIRVYAEYFNEKDIGYRKTTIIQIGDSWELLGSAILKNPGSAKPIDKKIEEKNLITLSSICPNSKRYNWKEFSVDATMQCLIKIFNGSYVGNPKEISGIILLFNLHYIREADINKARDLFNTSLSEHTFPNLDEVRFMIGNKPVFIGWFNEHKKLKNDTVEYFSNEIFNHLISKENCYLEKGFKENKFYHPLYINRIYSNPNFKNWTIFNALQKFQNQLDL